jgi:hypothetical protein
MRPGRRDVHFPEHTDQPGPAQPHLVERAPQHGRVGLGVFVDHCHRDPHPETDQARAEQRAEAKRGQTRVGFIETQVAGVDVALQARAQLRPLPFGVVAVAAGQSIHAGRLGRRDESDDAGDRIGAAARCRWAAGRARCGGSSAGFGGLWT